MNLSRGADRVSVHHDLFISNNRRNPHLVGCAGERAGSCRPEWPQFPVFDVRCNVVYNWGEEAIHLAGGAQANLVRNLFRRGPDTNLSDPPIEIQDRDPATGTRIYVAGNFDSTLGGEQVDLAASRTGAPAFAIDPFGTPAVTTCDVAALATASGGWGALPHDSVDLRLLDELATGGGNLGARGRRHDTPVPEPEPGEPLPDTDGDGLPDGWEMQWGLDPESAADGNADADGDGWTNLEEYLNGAAPSAGGSEG